MGEKAPGNLILTGFSFTGKSLVGREAARRLGWRFIDTDERIAEMAGKPVPDIFAQDGEAAFRAMERRALEDACAGEGAAIATGGGAVLDAANRSLMARRGVVVCLEARPETIYSRILAASQDSASVARPLLAGPDPLARIRSLKESRQPFYAAAHWTVHTDALTPEEVCQEVLRAWEMMARRWAATSEAEAPYCQEAGAACVVTTATQSYPVFVGWGILGELGQRMKNAGLSGAAFVVSDSGVLPHYQKAVAQSLAGFRVHFYRLEAGERSKSLASARGLYRWLAARHAERGDSIVALGGGVVGDLAGFVAATYLRGLPLVQVPTSLVAMVDASIGGKVAVNLPQAKNLVGAFYQPRLVLADVQALTTLPPRELASGWAEVIKHGMILDPGLIEFLEARAGDLLALEPGATAEAVARSARIKAGVVSRDEKETGERTLLNYGHTVGHALEASRRYRGLLHGEAVALGMMVAAELSHRLGLAPASVVQRQQGLLLRFGLPVKVEKVSHASLLRAMALDKKVRGQALRWVLLAGIGQPIVKDDVPLVEVEMALRSIFGEPGRQGRAG